MSRKRKYLGCATIVVVAIGSVALWMWTIAKHSEQFRLHGHKHCIKSTGSALRAFAMANDGKFPAHTNGWGDALLLLVRSNYLDIPFICGPTDDGRVFREALENGTDVPEELCSRVYVQGLTDANLNGVCILYDRHSHPGGDHFYQIERTPVRECLDDYGSMTQIEDKRWPAFSRQQVELLMKRGFTRGQAEYYFPDGKE